MGRSSLIFAAIVVLGLTVCNARRSLLTYGGHSEGAAGGGGYGAGGGGGAVSGFGGGSAGGYGAGNYQVRYGKHLPYVLKSLTCTFPGRRKVGVVGRTGSGKSTLIQALFRVVEPTEGKIIIDGLDICTIGLHDLRSKLSIIPQDPAMFEGTMRCNLDPLEECSDLEVWKALDKCQLGETMRAKEGKLSSTVVENGENWSVGQRQLVCLGRALLKRSRILVLDEATASVDTATDSIIQRIIRSEFADCTVITIAHRIHTVIDSDLVLVLSEGRILEYDTPVQLLENKKSAFSKLIAEYSMRSSSVTNFLQPHLTSPINVFM